MPMELQDNDDSAPLPDDELTRGTFWKRHIDAWRATAMSQREYARQHELPIVRFTYWKNKFYPSTSSGRRSFVPVHMKGLQIPVRLIHPGGVVIECAVGTDVSWLQSLLGLNNAS
ncbi:MAG: hypothetical protein QGE95_12520 [Arenicellales bacterium]|jgi:hypothetical protein|nr:hypothetical protein [Arenicellales bacterium]|tara:strand:- start:2101 stop:2445 length:345 start_codon:yes stop_codon:yes gene_type:complete